MGIRSGRGVLASCVALAAAGGLVACTSGGAVPSDPTTSPSAGSAQVAFPPPSSTPPASGDTSVQDSTARSEGSGASAQSVFAAMTLRERIGQLLMVDCPTSGVSSATETAIKHYHAGSVILDGTNTEGSHHIRAVTSHLQRLAPRRADLFIATDQEGGEVQRLQGSGFSRIPTALDQGRLAPSTLHHDAQTWGHQLHAAGVSVNLAPVLDTVPAHFGSNPPIGDLDREYGHTTGRVSAHGLAYADGMTAAGVDVTVKHFPGLGRVHGNTDTTSGVTDTVTTRHDAYLAPFQAAVHDHVPFVMMSTAIYRKIDPGVPAAFSKTIVTGMLRGDLGFRGLIISDDIGAAKQVSGYSVGSRAVDFVKAGGDVVLTVDAGEAGTMATALLHKAASSPKFKKKVDAAALLVLQAKQARGLLH